MPPSLGREYLMVLDLFKIVLAKASEEDLFHLTHRRFLIYGTPPTSRDPTGGGLPVCEREQVLPSPPSSSGSPG